MLGTDDRGGTVIKVLDLVMGLRVPMEIEREGLDLTLHGEVVQ